MLYSGIDLHKRTIAIPTVDGEGTVVRHSQIAARHAALTAYFATLLGPHRAVVECTGMWYWVRDLLSAQGIDLRLGHAKYLKAIQLCQSEDRCGGCGDVGAAAPRRSSAGGAHDQR